MLMQMSSIKKSSFLKQVLRHPHGEVVSCTEPQGCNICEHIPGVPHSQSSIIFGIIMVIRDLVA